MSAADDKGTTSVSLVREALFTAVRRGLDVAPALQFARIDPEVLKSSRARVPVPAFARLWFALSELMDDEFFGIDSHPMRRGSFEAMCRACIASETLGEALQRILAFLRLVLDDMHGVIETQGERAILHLDDHGVSRRVYAYGTWLILVHGLACWLIQRRISVKALHFSAPRPDDDSDYRNRFCEAVFFNAPRSEMHFDAEVLNARVLQTPETLVTYLESPFDSLLVRYRNDESVGSQIRRKLRSVDPECWPELGEVAAEMQVSYSTLQRRLSTEGLSYRALKDALRRDIAIHLLSSSALTVFEIGERIGFQETSAFHRAFKKWTGLSPGAYRHADSGGPS